MNGFVEIIDGIYRLKVPFEAIYTSVFLIRSQDRVFLVDCATTDCDVDLVIVPALRKMGYELCDIDALVLSHRHSDHAGGARRISELVPDISIITDVRKLTEDITTYSLPGHTVDCIGIFDKRTNTLISADGLQGAGVDRYRCYTELPDAYIETLERLRLDEGIENILFSHAYEPWDTDVIFGRKDVIACLEHCKKYVRKEK